MKSRGFNMSFNKYIPGKHFMPLVFHIALFLHKVQKCTRLNSADAVVLPSDCVQRSCSRSLHGNCLRQGSNLYSTRYRLTALTSLPPYHTIIFSIRFLSFYVWFGVRNV